jgi:hypothetical protein
VRLHKFHSFLKALCFICKKRVTIHHPKKTGERGSVLFPPFTNRLSRTLPKNTPCDFLRDNSYFLHEKGMAFRCFVLNRVSRKGPMAIFSSCFHTSSRTLLTFQRLAHRIASFTFPGGVPERSKGADCKSAGSAFEGSNPSPSTMISMMKRNNKICSKADDFFHR